MNKQSAIKAALEFTKKIGRPPSRKDWRPPLLQEWREVLDLNIPNADSVALAFNGWNNFLDTVGVKPLASQITDTTAIERGALHHAKDIYPDLIYLGTEQSGFDGMTHNERIEVKGSLLAQRNNIPRLEEPKRYFSFTTHKRNFVGICDKVIMVGLGVHDDMLIPLVRYEFSGKHLALISNLSTVQVYTSTIWGMQPSKYRPFMVWKEVLIKAEKDYVLQNTQK